MTEYKVVGIFKINAGYIGLNEEQASLRRRGLTREGDSYQVKRPIEFKVGEIISLDGPLDKYALTRLEKIGQEEVETEAVKETVDFKPNKPKEFGVKRGGRS